MDTVVWFDLIWSCEVLGLQIFPFEKWAIKGRVYQVVIDGLLPRILQVNLLPEAWKRHPPNVRSSTAHEQAYGDKQIIRVWIH